MKLNHILLKKAFVVFTSSLMFYNCSDFLTRDHPTGITDEDYWKTTDECISALNNCIYLPTGTTNYQEPLLSWNHMEGMTDNMYWAGNFCTDIVNFGNGSLTVTDGGYVGSVWKNYYVFIRRCCRLLEHLDDAYFIQESERERIRAEARTWRAWYHMQLLLYYGRHDGIPIVDKELNGKEIYKSRNTVEECLNFINKEFDDVLAIDDDDIYPFLWDEDRRNRMCKAYALTLKMDLNLQFRRYDEAKKAAKAIIDSKQFELYYSESNDEDSGKNYRDLFKYAGMRNKERIIFKNGGCSEAWFRNAPASLSGQGAASVLKSFVDEFETADGRPLSDLPLNLREQIERFPKSVERDPRLGAIIYCDGEKPFKNFEFRPFAEGADLIGKPGSILSGYALKKFLDEDDRPHGWSGSLYFPLYRYAEVLLDYVECLVELNDWKNPDVEKYINMIRNRAGLPNMDKEIYNSQEKIRELYRRERRIELCFEGKRYWDIRRWNIGTKVMNGRVLGAWNPNTRSFIQIENRNCSFPKYDSWPIPLTEASVNTNIGQPEGWD